MPEGWLMAWALDKQKKYYGKSKKRARRKRPKMPDLDVEVLGPRMVTEGCDLPK